MLQKDSKEQEAKTGGTRCVGSMESTASRLVSFHGLPVGGWDLGIERSAAAVVPGAILW